MYGHWAPFIWSTVLIQSHNSLSINRVIHRHEPFSNRILNTPLINKRAYLVLTNFSVVALLVIIVIRVELLVYLVHSLRKEPLCGKGSIVANNHRRWLYSLIQVYLMV